MNEKGNNFYEKFYVNVDQNTLTEQTTTGPKLSNNTNLIGSSAYPNWVYTYDDTVKNVSTFYISDTESVSLFDIQGLEEDELLSFYNDNKEKFFVDTDKRISMPVKMYFQAFHKDFLKKYKLLVG